MLAGLLLLVASAQPVAATCCPQTARGGASIVSMPCCAGTCPVMNATPHQAGTSAILTTTSAAPALAPVATTAVAVPVAVASFAIQAPHQESPPPFLLHEQFRI